LRVSNFAKGGLCDLWCACTALAQGGDGKQGPEHITEPHCDITVKCGEVSLHKCSRNGHELALECQRVDIASRTRSASRTVSRSLLQGRPLSSNSGVNFMAITSLRSSPLASRHSPPPHLLRWPTRTFVVMPQRPRFLCLGRLPASLLSSLRLASRTASLLEVQMLGEGCLS
jgi:hypothetical protein